MDNQSQQLPLISVIVPVYNVGRYVERCLRSILDQSYKNLEVLVIDDGSTDETGHVCDMVVSNDSRVKVIHKNNEGVSVARNLGIEISNGEYIGFVDGDDYIRPETYEVLYSHMVSGAEVSICHIEGVPESCNTIEWPEPQFENRLLTENIILPKLVYDFDFISVANKLYSKRVLGGIRFQNVSPEDVDFNYRVFRQGISASYLNYYGYAARLRETSTTRKDPVAFTLKSRLSHCRMYCQYHQNHSTEESRAVAMNRLFLLIVKTKWDYYKTDFRFEAERLARRMKEMLIDEYKNNNEVLRGHRMIILLLYHSRSLYQFSKKIKGLLQ